jgi:hypothetical protein
MHLTFDATWLSIGAAVIAAVLVLLVAIRRRARPWRLTLTALFLFSLVALLFRPAVEWPGREPLEPIVAGDGPALLLSWPNAIPFGQPVEIAGQFPSPLGSGARLQLADPGGVIATNTLSESTFRFVVVPPTQGRVEYWLQLLEPNGALTWRFPVRLYVTPPSVLAILFLANSPSADARQLRSWLVAKGYHVAERIRVSKDTFRTSYYDIEPLQLDAIKPAVIERFQLLVADTAAFAQLPESDRGAVMRAVESGRLALVLQCDGSDQRLVGPFKLVPADAREELPIRRADDQREFVGSVGPNRVVAAVDQTVLIADPDGAPVVARTAAGHGSVTLNLITNTFRWWISGDQATYASFWSTVLRGPDIGPRWSIQNIGPVAVGDPVSTVRENVAGPVRALLDAPSAKDISLPAGQLVPHREIWEYRSYPEEPGWHRIRLERSDLPEGTAAGREFIRAGGTNSDVSDVATVSGAKSDVAVDFFAYEPGQLKFEGTPIRGSKYTAQKPAQFRAVQKLNVVVIPAWAFLLLLFCSAGSLWWLERSGQLQR